MEEELRNLMSNGYRDNQFRSINLVMTLCMYCAFPVNEKRSGSAKRSELHNGCMLLASANYWLKLCS